MTEFPCVSVVISTFHRAEMLERALASVLLQTYHDFEVIVVHDGPADDATVEVCKKYEQLFADSDNMFTFVALDENSGYQCVPKNQGIYLARGDYIAYLDDDNEWMLECLEVLVSAIEEGDVWPDFVYGRREYELAEGYEPDRELFTGESPFVPWTEQAAQRLASSASANFIDTSEVLMAKGALWRLHLATGNMWNEGYRRFADWELITRAVHFSGWRGKGVDEVVQTYYWHGNNIQLTRSVSETPKQQVLTGRPLPQGVYLVGDQREALEFVDTPLEGETVLPRTRERGR